MTPDPNEPALPTSTNRRSDVGTVNAAVIHALLTHNWPELDRLVPRTVLVDTVELDDTPIRVD